MTEWPIGIHCVEDASTDNTNPGEVTWKFLCGPFVMEYDPPMDEAEIDWWIGRWINLVENSEGELEFIEIPAPTE